MQINGGGLTSIEQVTGEYLNKNKSTNVSPLNQGQSFDAILRKQAEIAGGSDSTGEVKFSKHANERLLSRNIDLSQEQMDRLNDGTTRARAKGINESLVVVDNLAFIVNVKNNTVVTAVGESDDKIFTNIDGAVIA